MADEQPAGREPTRPEESAPGRSPIVFVTDASAEAERIGERLRAAGYVVAEVPISNLASRVAAQRPNVVLLDVDAEGVLDELAKVRKQPGTGSIDFVYLGTGDGIVKNIDDALANDGTAFFLRPVDVGALIREMGALTGGPLAQPQARPSRSPLPSPPSRPPPSRPPLPSRPPPSRPPLPSPPSRPSNRAPGPSSDRPSTPSLPAPGLRGPGPPLPMSTTSLADLVASPRSLASFGTVSDELQQLLADAEAHAEVPSASELAFPSPEEEIEAVLPADVLASLDEPIDGDEEEDDGGEGGRGGSGPERDVGTGAHAKGTTASGSRQPTTGGGVRSSGTGSETRDHGGPSDTPPRSLTGGGERAGGSTTASALARPRPGHAPVPAMTLETRSTMPRPSPRWTGPREGQSSDPTREERPPPAPSSWHPPPSMGAASVPGQGSPRLRGDEKEPSRDVADTAPLRGASLQPGPSTGAIVVIGSLDARRFFAEAIARRATGSLCFESEGVVRRVVLRDGDLVAAASSGESESLVHFLATRGELSRDEVPRLAAKIPPYGRHAGAALVAHGWVRQDQLWVVLRAHAEWIASAILRLGRGSAQLEPEPTGRLRGEPSVFGAATGAEILVELVRRAVPSEEALECLGGEATRIADGANYGLLAECSVPPQDLELIHRARGGTIADLLARAGDGEIVAVLHALALLGVLEAVPSPDFGRRDSGDRTEPEGAALDEGAIRARVRARLELVDEGDYFSVLGVTRDATGYEVRRAFMELRRAFEPARILTPRLLDLADDVRKIVVVLEEAYEILHDGARRERYRRAIAARPE